ncbi:hypothetical protein PUNSTDRAFT_144117 [Punctularia strigosozonata HHB-11173 SS5]|uniref:uncharacterized protein n=1 Tax=Punctularia strigosozonata (strain HHB-11173) TaxID=741275 RepID=UPI00044183EA|nr:uncharacterized protein PUNSTDRAFT_144117 [Punctularia strigosozonata HHB-11173 SS5]EIN08593.1 hypothetical protein PUNSTDRAFT_144117 [Punctularia strigosozonata HHB-11173 SS5]
MKFFAALLALGPALAGVNALAPTRTSTLASRDGLSFNPPLSVVEAAAASTRDEVLPRTNAERLARGLPLKKPHRRSPSPSYQAKRATASSVAYTGVVRVVEPNNNNAVRGYLAATPTSFGEYGGTTTDISSALTITFTTSDPSSPFDISISGTYPDLGFTTGFANTDFNFGPGAYNYAYLTGVSGSPAGSSATIQPNSYSAVAGITEGTESAVWTWDSASGALTPRWVNTDGSTPAVTLLYVPSANAVAITGDPAAFNANFGTSTVVAFEFVQA